MKIDDQILVTLRELKAKVESLELQIQILASKQGSPDYLPAIPFSPPIDRQYPLPCPPFVPWSVKSSTLNTEPGQTWFLATKDTLRA